MTSGGGPTAGGTQTGPIVPADSGKHANRPAIITGVFGIIGVAIAGFFGLINKCDDSHEPPPQPPSIQSQVEALNQDSGLTVSDPRNNVGVVPRCFLLSGVAPSSKHGDIWVAHQDTGGGAFYFNLANREAASSDWTAKLQLGDEDGAGLTFNVWAFLVPTDLSPYLSAIGSAGGTALPPGYNDELPQRVLKLSNLPNEGC